MSKATRWTKRILLGLLGLIVVAVAALVITIHTDYGRELIRAQVETQLDNTFVGGARVGKVEGSPFSELTIHDLVINGPDGEPAITIGSLELEVGLLALVSKQVRLTGLTAEDVDVLLKRDPDGTLQITRMMKPKDDEQKSGWAIDIPDIRLFRGHVALDMGEGAPDRWMNLDDITIYGAAHMPVDKPLEANVSIRSSWRERAAGIGIDAVVVSDPAEGITRVPSMTAMVGGVTVAANALRFAPSTEERPMVIEGLVTVNAPAVAVAQLAPQVQLPADVALSLIASSRLPWTDVSLIGQVGPTPLRAMINADLAVQRALGVVATGDLDLAALSDGKLDGQGGALVVFDATNGKAGELPVANGVVTTWGQFLDLPATNAAIAFSTDSQHASTVIGIGGDSMKATLAAQIKKVGDVITLEHGKLVASTSNPQAASGGKAPLRGAVAINLSARGAVSPEPNLAVEGRIQGKRLRSNALRVSSLDLAVDASQLPKQPKGRLELVAEGIVNNDMQLGRLELNAANRNDGRLAVTLRSEPKRSPWLLELDALVTPPGEGEIVTVDLVRHHIRAGSGGNWRGTSGHIEIGPQQLLVRDLTSKGANGELSIAATMDRAGRDQGDLVAKIDATGIDLDNFSPAYRGSINAHVDVTRTDGRWAGDVDVSAKGISLDPRTLTLDADLKVSAQADKLVVDAKASSLRLGSTSLQLDVDAPKDIANVEMWKHLHRDVIRKARLSFENVNLGQLADLAGQKDQVAGTLDGDLVLDAASTGGVIRIRDITSPRLPVDGEVNANLSVAQTGDDELTPRLTGRIGTLGRFEAVATLGIPDHLFDPAEWQKLGKGALKGASLRVDDVKFDPASLDKLGVATQFRGQATLAAEVGPAVESAQLAVDVTNLRGSPISEPVEAHFAVAIDGKDTNTSLAVKARTATLLELRGRVPLTMAEAQANPKAALEKSLDVTATIPTAPAPAILGVFGRTEVTGGTIRGTVRVTGKVGDPRVAADLMGAMIAVPPGPNNKPIKTLEEIRVTAKWDGKAGTLAVRGRQNNGTLELVAKGNPDDLDTGTVTMKAKQFDLVPLLIFAPGAAGGAAGRLDADLRAVGLNPANMKLAGELHLRDARMPIAPQVGTLRRANVDVVVGESEMKVKVNGRLGRGDLALDSTFALTGVTPTSGEATMTLRKVSPIGTVEPVIDANVTAKLRREGNAWVSDVVVSGGNIVIPKGGGEKLKPIGLPDDMIFATGAKVTEIVRDEPDLPPKEPTIIVNLRLKATHVESAEVRGIIKGKLTLSADPRSVGIVGTIEADRGQLDLFGRRYMLERAGVRFDGSTDPVLDVVITHDFPEVTTTTQVRGRLSKPELIMSSDPAIYSQGQLLGFLLGGEPNGDPQSGSAREQATSAGASFVANKIGGYVRNALPIDIDVLRYEAASASESAAVTVGTWLTRSLFLAYRRHLEARPNENAGQGEIEYWISRRVMVEGVVGDRGYNGVDLLWRKRY